MNRPDRRYWLDTTYDRLDRMKLVELVRDLGYHLDDDELTLESRADLIDLLVSTRVEAEYDAEEADDEYPLRRPVTLHPPEWLTDGAQPRLHLRWEDQWEDALDRLLDDDASWDLPATIRDGDVILTVLGCEPPVLAALDHIGGSGDEWQVDDRVLIAQPITWWSLWPDQTDREELRGFTGRLNAATARRTLRALHAQAQHPKPAFITAGDCTHVGVGSSAIEVLARLQAVEGATDGLRGPAVLACGTCGSTDPLEVHFDRPLHEVVQLEIQDHLDDVAHLCSACHRLVHPHSVASQRMHLSQVATPPCPACGHKTARPIVWGMPSSDDFANHPDVIFGGCVIDDPIPAQWQCDHCGEQYVTVTMTQLRIASGLGQARPTSAASS